MAKPRSGTIRFLTVINLFLSIFWAFYSLWIQRLWHSRDWYEERRRRLFTSQARRFRNTAVDLGGLMIKLGQFFSTRVDVLPQAVTRELAGLQDEVQPVDFAELRPVVEAEFGRPLEEIYEYLDETPLAAASLGQVHCGRLAAPLSAEAGENQASCGGPGTVAVKIQRPGIEDLVDTDLKAIRRVIDLIRLLTDWEKYADFDAIFREFSTIVHEELDYIHEGHNAETIAANLAGDRETIIPRIYWEHTTRRVLTMEFEEGMKVTDYGALAAAGVSRPRLARKLLEIYIRQILVDGFFHADPHPGNIFVTPAGKVILIDFGMVGTISRPLREALVQLAHAAVRRDYEQVVTLVEKVGFLRRGVDTTVLIRAMEPFMEQILGQGGDLFSSDLGEILEDMETLLYEQPFQIPANFTFLGKALGTLYGLCVGLDPEINFLDEARPYVTEFARANVRVWDIVKERAVAIGSSLVELPPLTERVLHRAERGDLHFKVTLQGLDEKLAANTRAINRLVWVLAFGFTLGASAYLLVNNHPAEARYGLAAGGLLLLVMLFGSGGGPRRRRIHHPPPIPRRGKP
jgi:predicted unusual protein kinase regulating ubiquinone biosynthesis (AarF/ABC1/UbiB family)